ncbi:MAG: hypothetical protein OEQ39_26965, partial [Gammaproteobacteria bacterium]|nr:hypothetical protein [Gammaproteobacteria bacterium]
MHVWARLDLPMRFIAACCLALVLATGCSQKVRSFFFDGVESGPLPPTTKVRQNLLRENQQLERELEKIKRELEIAKNIDDKDESEPLAAEKAQNWPEASELLPKHKKSGQVDWGKALHDGIVAPRSGLRLDTPRQAVLDFNVKIARAGGGFAVNFAHNAHTEWLSCDACHPAIFPLEHDAPRPVITMSKIADGQYCGACHGKVVFGVKNACARCHGGTSEQAEWKPEGPPRAPIERVAGWDAAAKLLPVTMGAPDWSKALNDGIVDPRAGLDESVASQPVLPLDINLIPANNPLFAVTFPHQAHTEWLGCNNCHAGIFQMKRGANPITMTKI